MTNSLFCCICHETVAPPYKMLGRRVYCERHYARVNKPHTGFWRAGVLQIVAMGVFAAIVAAIAESIGALEGTPLIVAGLFLAVVPTALWLVYFYQQDKLEPEPKTKIAAVFLLALILADFVGLRLIHDWFRFDDWSGINRTTSLLASILIVGFTFEAIKYFAIRLTVWATDEFDERMDGIVYGTVAGLGVATLLNLNHIVANQGVALGPGVVYTVTTALAQASFGGLLGYFMAQAKFEHKPIWWVPLGIVIAAVLDGFFTWVIDEVSAAGLTVEPWRSLVLGVVVALAVFGVLVALMQRAHTLTNQLSA
ncbi:MAG: PrsW family glutamic-type intramembrane protease [Anaerolineales bacterium]|nr:PrsW family glutamic-type intramembrane protease [Anaerolineales bacterium]